jgi:hypothetical protein
MKISIIISIFEREMNALTGSSNGVMGLPLPQMLGPPGSRSNCPNSQKPPDGGVISPIKIPSIKKRMDLGRRCNP